MIISVDTDGNNPDRDSNGPILLTPARGPGARNSANPLYETTLHGQLHVAWTVEDGRMACAPATCPHRPALGPILHSRGVIDAGNVLCTRHANLYSGVSGECIVASGPGDPGQMMIRFGTRVGDALVLDEPTRSPIDRQACASIGP